MLWPEARRSPSVGIVGATPTPSTDTQATGRPAAASSRRRRKRSRLSGGKYDSAHVVVTRKTQGYGGRSMKVCVHRRQHGRMSAWLDDAGFVVEACRTVTSAESALGGMLLARRALDPP